MFHSAFLLALLGVVLIFAPKDFQRQPKNIFKKLSIQFKNKIMTEEEETAIMTIMNCSPVARS
jgi:hypothetical protein